MFERRKDDRYVTHERRHKKHVYEKDTTSNDILDTVVTIETAEIILDTFSSDSTSVDTSTTDSSFGDFDGGESGGGGSSSSW